MPGTNTPAYVTSFALVLSDVDNPDATAIEIYQGDKLIGKCQVPASDKKYSFAGLQTWSGKITSVKITAGNTPVAASVQDNAAKDIVVFDDLFAVNQKLINKLSPINYSLDDVF